MPKPIPIKALELRNKSLKARIAALESAIEYALHSTRGDPYQHLSCALHATGIYAPEHWINADYTSMSKK